MTYSSLGASRVPLVSASKRSTATSRPIAGFLMRWRADGTFDGLYLSITCAEDVPLVATDAAERDDPTYLGGYRVRAAARRLLLSGPAGRGPTGACNP